MYKNEQILRFIDTCNWCRNNKITCDECIGFDPITHEQKRICPRNEELFKLLDSSIEEGKDNEISKY